jgi:hypothetical protein
MKLFSNRSTKNRLEDFVRDRAVEMSVVHERVDSEAFLQFCIKAARRPLGRDTRRQSLIRTMRRMQERGDLPFVVDGGAFVLAKPIKREPTPPLKRFGRTELAVLRAADELSLLADSVSVEDLVARAIAPLEVADGRDTRRQTALRSVQSLARSGDLRLASGRVVFGTPCQGLL